MHIFLPFLKYVVGENKIRFVTIIESGNYSESDSGQWTVDSGQWRAAPIAGACLLLLLVDGASSLSKICCDGPVSK